MIRSIVVLSLILAIVLILTAFILRHPTTPVEEPSIKFNTTMSLSPYRYNQDIGITSERKPQYTFDEFIARGYELRRQGNAKKAEDIFKTALLFEADNPEILKQVGEMAFVDGRFLEATNYFAQYLAARPERVEAYTNLAIALIRADNLAAAELTVNKGLGKLGQTQPGPLHFILACIQQKKGDVKQAEELLNKSYHALGDDMFKLVNSHWSSAIQELPAYQRIVAERAAAAPRQPEAERKPDQPQNP